MRRQFQLRKTIFHAYASDFRPYKKSVVSVTEYLRTQFSCLRERDAGGRRIYDFAALVSLRVRGGVLGAWAAGVEDELAQGF